MGMFGWARAGRRRAGGVVAYPDGRVVVQGEDVGVGRVLHFIRQIHGLAVGQVVGDLLPRHAPVRTHEVGLQGLWRCVCVCVCVCSSGGRRGRRGVSVRLISGTRAELRAQDRSRRSREGEELRRAGRCGKARVTSWRPRNGSGAGVAMIGAAKRPRAARMIISLVITWRPCGARRGVPCCFVNHIFPSERAVDSYAEDRGREAARKGAASTHARQAEILLRRTVLAMDSSVRNDPGGRARNVRRRRGPRGAGGGSTTRP